LIFRKFLLPPANKKPAKNVLGEQPEQIEALRPKAEARAHSIVCACANARICMGRIYARVQFSPWLSRTRFSFYLLRRHRLGQKARRQRLNAQ
jgi:hypothetical protein